MGLFTRQTAAVAATVVGLLFGSGALAQESVLPLPLERIDASTALAKSFREHRVLIVVREWKLPSQGRRPWWVNDSIRAWLAWHAVIVQLDPNDPESRDYLRKYPPNAATEAWGFDVVMNGKRWTPVSNPPAGIPNAKGLNDRATTTGIGLTATYVLFQLDFQLEMMLARQPTWATAHQHDCPEPKRPERTYQYNQAKDGLPPQQDADESAPSERYVDVLARVQEADTLVANGDRLKAGALLTWAWERGAELDPAFALARVGIVLPRLAALAKREGAVGRRMVELGDAELALYPWYDDAEELGYLALRYCSGQGNKVALRLITENIDLDEETMGGLVAARLGDLKARLSELSDQRVIAGKDWAQIMQAARLRVPKTADPQVKERWEQQRVEVLTVGGLRTYTALLASDNPAERDRAALVAKDVITEAATAPPLVRAGVLRAFVFAAASVGRAGPDQGVWLSQAAALEQAEEQKKKLKPGEQPRSGLTDPLARYIGASQK
jgi:hypothetical protein